MSNELNFDYEDFTIDNRGFESFMRERSIYCGDTIREVDIVPITAGQRKYYKNARRRSKTEVTAPKIRDLNDRRARRYLTQIINSNFLDGLHLTATYDSEHLPTTIDEADRLADNYVSRISRLYKKHGTTLKYVIITAYSNGRRGEKLVRVHHHILINRCPEITRDDVENLWRERHKREDGSKYGLDRFAKPLGKPYGFSNCDNIKPDGNGAARLAGYLKRQPTEKTRKRWRGSQSLTRPTSPEPNDDRYTRAEIERISAAHPKNPDVKYWERRYPGWTLCPDFEYSYVVRKNERIGTAVYLRLIKKDVKKNIVRRNASDKPGAKADVVLQKMRK